MALKFFDARKFKRKKKIDRNKLIRAAFREACAELTLNLEEYETYEKARKAMIGRAKENQKNNYCSK